MGWGAIASAIGSITGGIMDRNEARNSAKKQYKYNKWLQEENQEFQREMAKNAHQYEMEDLEAAGLNPALTVTGSSAGSIAGSSSSQGTSPGGNIGQNMSQIISDINNTRNTNAGVKKINKETEVIPQQIANETTSAKANLINAQANKQNADTEKELAEKGWGGKILGTENEYAEKLPGIVGTAAALVGGGPAIFGALKAGKAIGKAKVIFRKADKVRRKLKLKSSAR